MVHTLGNIYLLQWQLVSSFSARRIYDGASEGFISSFVLLRHARAALSASAAVASLPAAVRRHPMNAKAVCCSGGELAFVGLRSLAMLKVHLMPQSL